MLEILFTKFLLNYCTNAKETSRVPTPLLSKKFDGKNTKLDRTKVQNCTGKTVLSNLFFSNFRAYSFYLPEDKSAPIMLVGPGTGIAPFRSFWQENICENRENEIILYFGCRHPLKDNIYKQEMNDALAKKGLTKLHVAYSRQEFKPKVKDCLFSAKHTTLFQHSSNVFI